VLARLNGRDITMEEYSGYLLASLGKSKLDEYIDRLLIGEEAKRLGIALGQEQVEAALEERLDRTIKSLYQGSKERFEESLKKKRLKVEEYKSKLRQELYYDLMVEQVILKQRAVTDEAVRQEFERVYGREGVQYVLRHVLVAKGRSTEKEGPRTDLEARERAEKVLKEIQEGKDFVQAVKEYSDDAYTQRNEGRIPHYRKGLYGEEFDAAVAQLTPEKPMTGVVVSARGYHLVQLVERRVTRFEDVEKDLREAVKNKPASAREKQELAAGLREKAKIEGF
jgi:hypothetical protein